MELQQIKPFSQNKYPSSMGPVKFNLQMLTVPQATVYYNIPQKFLCGRKRKTMDTRYQSFTSMLKSNYGIVLEPKVCPKYRPIRPKPIELTSISNKKTSINIPYISNYTVNSILNSTNNQLSTTTAMANTTTMINTVNTSTTNTTNCSNTHKNQEIQKSSPIDEITIKTNCESPEPMVTNDSNFKLLSEEDIEEICIKEDTNIKKDCYVTEASDKVDKGSIELFFKSMARTVLGLPKHIQAEIKMEICKIVTNAEIKYSSWTCYGTD